MKTLQLIISKTFLGVRIFVMLIFRAPFLSDRSRKAIALSDAALILFHVVVAYLTHTVEQFVLCFLFSVFAHPYVRLHIPFTL